MPSLNNTPLRPLLLIGRILGIVALLAIAHGPAFSQATDEERASAFRRTYAAWRKAGYPDLYSHRSQSLLDAAFEVGRGDVLEALLTRGPVLRKMVRIPPGGRPTPLQVVRTFKEVSAALDEEMFSSMIHSWQKGEGWLARRLTADRIEIWTPAHGWLYDGAGRLVHEAAPPRRTGKGREWFGAFLPDGRWITTDLDEMDGNLYFFSKEGVLLRTLTHEALAPDEYHERSLLGWGRSDKIGTGWVVNVGSEEGRATVWVGPEGPARMLQGFERWQLCYPRALGPRGWYIEMSVPDDSGQYLLSRREAGHGKGVGFPSYGLGDPKSRAAPPSKESDPVEPGSTLMIPNGNEVFGFWPGRRDFFLGSEDYNGLSVRGPEASDKVYEPSGYASRKGGNNIDKTWFFNPDMRLAAWIRARRIADAADGRAMLFRVTADSRIVTLSPDLEVQAMRRMTWKDGSTADAVTLWDDLRMGLFIRDKHLVLARWGAPGKGHQQISTRR